MNEWIKIALRYLKYKMRYRSFIQVKISEVANFCMNTTVTVTRQVFKCSGRQNFCIVEEFITLYEYHVKPTNR